MKLAEIQAVIDSAKARGTEPLERFIRDRLQEATEDEVQEAVSVAIEIIETVPILMASASQAAEERGLTAVVEPVLEHATRYFLHPMDLIPEMTQGLAGLLDDAYLVMRILQNLQRGPKPLLDWDLDEPIRFIRRIVGRELGEKLDQLAMTAMSEVSESVTHLWQHISVQA